VGWSPCGEWSFDCLGTYGDPQTSPRACAPTASHTLAHRSNSFAPASMDSPLVTQIFRQLFSHRASQCLARGARPAIAAARTPYIQRRGKATRFAEGESKRESRWTPRKNAFPQERTEEFERYPLVTADMMRSRKERPRRVKMLLRDFIEGEMLRIAHDGTF
jgi:hypothetical protein